LENEAVFLRLLSRDNYDLYFESSAISYHTNVSGFYSFLKSEFLGGRQFTGLIVTYEDWDIPKRIAFAAITPLRPILKICRVIRDLYKTRRLLKLIFPIFPILVTGVVVNAVGELLGYTMGIGDTSLKRLDIELKRNRN